MIASAFISGRVSLAATHSHRALAEKNRAGQGSGQLGVCTPSGDDYFPNYAIWRICFASCTLKCNQDDDLYLKAILSVWEPVGLLVPFCFIRILLC